jgi:succinate dehydrogenase hydrophobic anchor subunit
VDKEQSYMMRSRKVPHPGWNLEYLMFIFTRFSGMAILILAIIGITGAFLMNARTQVDLETLLRWTFFPNPSHVLDSEIPEVYGVWANAFWQTMQMAIVFFGATHGFNGLRVVLEDYIHRPAAQFLSHLLIFLAWGFVMIISIFVILSS